MDFLKGRPDDLCFNYITFVMQRLAFQNSCSLAAEVAP
jgi:hypothetical protein